MEQLFEKFGIHANLLIAQIVNFGILFFVLYKLVYRPILSVLDERRKKIEHSLKQAQEIEERNLALGQEINDKLNKAKKEAEVMIGKAKEVGEQSRSEIIARANQEVDSMIQKTKADLALEKEKMMGDIKEYIIQSSLLIVEKIMKNKLDPATQKTLVLDSLKELTPSKS